MTYYAERKVINEGQNPVTTTKYGNRRQMERQFHLFCANACDGDEFINDLDAIEWGTVEQGAIELRKVYRKPQPEPEPEPEEPVEEPTA